MYATDNAVRAIDRKRLKRSALISAILWAVLLPLLSLMRYESLDEEASMNPIYIELETPPPPKAKVQPEPEKVEIAETAAQAAPAASSAPAARAEKAPAAARARPVPEPAAPTPSLRPDPSASISQRKTASAATRGGAVPLPAISENALRTSPSDAPMPGSPPPAVKGPAKTTPAGNAPARGDKFDKDLRAASERLAAAPAGAGAQSAGSPDAKSSAKAGSGARADLEGGFDFGPGAKRELLSPRRIKVPDRILAGLPALVSTSVSFKIEAGGTVYKGSIRFDPPLPDELASYLRTAFSAWQFSFADSDGQVVFRYSIKVR